MAFRKFLSEYKKAVQFSGLKIRPVAFISIMIVLAIVSVILSYMFFDVVFGVVIAVLVLNIGLGLPFYIADKKVDSIEQKLPDVLHHISTTLKTGETVERALKEVTKIDYGAITDGLKDMLREMNEGKPFEDAFKNYALMSRSDMLQKSAIIIVAAKNAGGGLVETLIAMSNEIREIYRLKQERKSKTFMQFLFILVAGSIVAPFIFGILKSVLLILLKLNVTSPAASGLVSNFDIMFKLYLVIASALTTLGAIQVKDGRLTKGMLLVPIMVVISYIIYVFSDILFASFIGV